MFSTAVVLSMADASLGRPDPHYFSDQMRMELLVTSILESKTRNSKTLPPFYDAQGDFLDACQWSGISCDHDANVTAINWQLCTWLQYAQTFFFEYAPPNIRTLEISYNEFSCTVDFTPLGENLTDLYVGRNRFHGETKTADIPRAVAYLWLEYNNFSRSIALERLPPGLITFYAGHNAYSVTVRLDNLPPMLENLYLMYNKLLGPLCFENMPASLKDADLQGNAFDLINPALIPQKIKVNTKKERLRADKHFEEGVVGSIVI